MGIGFRSDGHGAKTPWCGGGETPGDGGETDGGSEAGQIELPRDAHLAASREGAVGCIVDDELYAFKAPRKFPSYKGRDGFHVSYVIVGKADGDGTVEAVGALEHVEDMLDEVANGKLLGEFWAGGVGGGGEFFTVDRVFDHALPELFVCDGAVAAHGEIIVEFLGVGAEFLHFIEPAAISAQRSNSSLSAN